MEDYGYCPKRHRTSTVRTLQCAGLYDEGYKSVDGLLCPFSRSKIICNSLEMQLTIGSAVIVLGLGTAAASFVLYREKIVEFVKRHASYFQRSEKVRKFDEQTTCLNILACQHIDDLQSKNRIVPVESRAIPNKRLVDVFGIDNAFTTFDDKRRMEFRHAAAGKLPRADDRKWRDIAEMARELVRRWIERGNDSREGIPLVTLVQTVTMSISLYVLFESLNPLVLDVGLVSQTARCINELWIESKNNPPNKESVVMKRSELQQALGDISRDFDFTPTRTPLNFILPAFETLWRVVLRCFIEVSFRNNDSTHRWQQVLQTFVDDPSESRFRHCAEGTDVAASFIVSEGLRLYPPTRRVYREFQFGYIRRETVAADIEKCQRSAIWGAESNLFKPSRWNNVSRDVRGSFMPFGGGSFTCPAQHSFGPRMIGILVAALASEIPSDSWRIVSQDSREGEPDYHWPDGPLDPARNAFSSLKLWRRPTSFVGQQE